MKLVVVLQVFEPYRELAYLSANVDVLDLIRQPLTIIVGIELGVGDIGRRSRIIAGDCHRLSLTFQYSLVGNNGFRGSITGTDHCGKTDGKRCTGYHKQCCSYEYYQGLLFQSIRHIA